MLDSRYYDDVLIIFRYFISITIIPIVGIIKKESYKLSSTLCNILIMFLKKKELKQNR